MSRRRMNSTLAVLGIALIVVTSALEADAGRFGRGRSGGRRGGGFGRRSHSGRSFGRRGFGRRQSSGHVRSRFNRGRRGSFRNRLGNRGAQTRGFRAGGRRIGWRGRRWGFRRFGWHRHHHFHGFGFGYYRRSIGFGFAFVSGGGGYYNPYCDAPIGGYDYSTPVVAFDSATSESTGGLQSFDAAIASFYAADYDSALQSIRSAARELPNNSDVHQFHGLVLFAQGNYRDAAAVVHASLTSSSGWNWTTLRNFYAEAATYTAQLRKLEEAKKANPDAAELRFLLGYHYLMLNHKEAAQTQLARAIQLQPDNELAKQLLKLAGTESATAEVPTTGGLGALAQAGREAGSTDADKNNASEKQPTGDTLELTGNWTAKPASGVEITLTMNEGSTFIWKVTSDGQTNQFTGNITIDVNKVTLARENSTEKLEGTITFYNPNSFRFQLDDGPELTFTR